MALGLNRLANSNHFRNLSLCSVATLCLLVLGAGTAHAEAQWRIIGAPLQGEEKETVAITSNTSQVIVVSTLNLSISCSKMSLDSGVISDEPGGNLQGTLLYTGCTATSSGKEVPKCNPLEEKITAGAVGQLISHTDGKTYLLVKPPTGKPLATIVIGPECALAETSNLTGQIVAECLPVESCEEEKATHKLKANETGLFSDSLKFGANKATYKGEFTLELSGEGKGQEWQGNANPPPTKLCKVAPTENAVTHRLKCPAGPPAEGYSGEIRGELLSGIGSLESIGEPGTEITCNDVKYAGKFEENGTPAAALGGINNLTYTAVGGGACPSTLAGNPAVTVTFLNLPYSKSGINYSRLGNPQGILVFRPQAANKPVRLKLAFGAVTCEYKRFLIFVGSAFNGVGANPSSLLLSGIWKRAVGGAACPAELKDIALLTLKRPNPMVGQPDLSAYVASE